MENKEEYGTGINMEETRAAVNVRLIDINDIIEYAKATGQSSTEALDNVISAGLRARYQELEKIPFPKRDDVLSEEFAKWYEREGLKNEHTEKA